ncbi:hypothetical protein ACFL2U_02755 [Patescibacteria group bacterium]
MIEIDFSYLIIFFDQFKGLSSTEILWILMFKYWGWLLILYIFLKYLIYPEWQLHQAIKWASGFPPAVLLAIDVPKRNEQSILAMENMFDHLQGLHGTFPKWEEYYVNAFQRSLSLELVSIDGYIQYLIRCPGDWRNLVEAAVYGQFPDAEITEVEDYTTKIPTRYPDDKYDVWGVEMALAGPDVQPLKSWRKFEHNFVDPIYVDPMAALLENMSSIGQGEQIWIQYILTPLGVDWGIKEGKKAVDVLLEKPEPKKAKGLISSVFENLASLVSEFGDQLAGIVLDGSASSDEKEIIRFPQLSPGQKDLIEGIEKKVGQRAFNVKIRYVYISEHGKMNKTIGVNGIIGAFKQWLDQNSNGLRPMLKETSSTRPLYYLKDYRRNARRTIIMQAYKNRSTVVGVKGKPMCSEELASLWHFPSMNLKVPMLKQTEFTKAAAPSSLPFGAAPLAQPAEGGVPAEPEEKTLVEPSFDYDSDEFEMQFAKDKKAFVKSRPQRAEQLGKVSQEEQEKLKKLWEKDGKSKEKLVKAKDTSDLKKGKPAKPKSSSPNNIPFID